MIDERVGRIHAPMIGSFCMVSITNTENSICPTPSILKTNAGFFPYGSGYSCYASMGSKMDIILVKGADSSFSPYQPSVGG